MRPFSVACAPGIGTGACLWAVSTVVEGPARWGLWTAALVLEAASRLVVRGVIAAMPVHELHLPERLAMLTLLSFVVLSAEALGQDVGVVRTAAWAVVAFALWWGYSEFTDGTALLRGPRGGSSSTTRTRRCCCWRWWSLPRPDTCL